jgi:hypothetical protein
MSNTEGEVVVEYVMVPVPEELADDVARFMMVTDMRRVSEVDTEVDMQAVVAFIPALNARCRTVLSALANSAQAGSNLTIGELARVLGAPGHETFGVVHELIELVWAAFGPTLSLVQGSAPDLQDGRLDWEARYVFIWRDLAAAVVAAEAQLAEGA